MTMTRTWQERREEACRELVRRVEGAVQGGSFGEAMDYLRTGEARRLARRAGLADRTPAQIVERVTGFRV